VQACEVLDIVAREVEYSSDKRSPRLKRNNYFWPDSGGFDWPNANDDDPLGAPKPNMPGVDCAVACLFSVEPLVPAAPDPKANAPAPGVELLPNMNEGLFCVVLEVPVVLNGCVEVLFEDMPKENVGAVVDAPGAAGVVPLAAGVEPNRDVDFEASGALVSVGLDVAVAPNLDVLPKRDELEPGAAVVPKASADFGGAPAGVVLTLLPKVNVDFGGGPAGVVVAALLPNTEAEPGVPAGVVLMGGAMLFAGVWGSAGFVPNNDPLGVPAGVVDAPKIVCLAVWFAGVEGKAD